MHLTLKYNAHSAHKATAVFIAGNQAAVWLRELSQWNIHPAKFECYVVPQSVKTIEPGGLLVIVHADDIKLPEHLPAYTCLANQLYIPVHAEIYPPVSSTELQKILLWQVQFFHPTIGLVGFEKKDRLNLADLITITEPVNQSWHFAHPGQPPLPQLQRISVLRPDEDPLAAIKKEIDQQPLKDIPKKNGDTPGIGKKIVRGAAIAGLAGAAGIIGGTGYILSKVLGGLAGLLPEGESGGSTGNYRNNATTDNGDSFFSKLFERFNTSKLADWINRNLEELQRERNSEIQRLMRMLDEDPLEGLRYAIPLGSNYQNRGDAPQSSRLLPRNLNFNLGLLGGGRAGDAWDIGHYYNDLRSKYLKAAQKEIERGNFKRAAYIYAHLLNDYHSAANVLMQGKMYSEAAAVYKDHLKNNQAAAECLEKGGLLHDAIDLYLELGKNEKAGDLYKQLSQYENAARQYQLAADKCYTANDYLETARIYRHKLNQPEKASATFLLGWQQGVQREPCLKNYFSMVSETGNENLPAAIKGIYSNTDSNMQTSLLNVLLEVNKQQPGDEVKQVNTAIAYEVVSHQVELGNINTTSLLNSFIENDKMLGTDISRFRFTTSKQPVYTGTATKFHLNNQAKWLSAVNYQNIFLAVGILNSRLIIARANWYGHIDYLLWDEPLRLPDIQLIATPLTNNVVLLLSHENSLSSKAFTATRYFERECKLIAPNWLTGSIVALAINGYDQLIVFSESSDGLIKNTYKPNGDLQNTQSCYYRGKPFSLTYYLAFAQVLFKSNWHFIHSTNNLIAISDNGHCDLYGFELDIVKVITAHRLDAAYFIVATNNEIQYLSFNGSVINISAVQDNEEDYTNSFTSHNWQLQTPEKFTDIIMLSGKQFAVASATEIEIYNFDKNEPVSIFKTKTKRPVVSLLSSSGHTNIAALLDNGEIETYNF